VVKAVTSLLMASLLMAEIHEEGHHTAEINMLLVVIGRYIMFDSQSRCSDFEHQISESPMTNYIHTQFSERGRMDK